MFVHFFPEVNYLNLAQGRETYQSSNRAYYMPETQGPQFASGKFLMIFEAMN